MKGLKLDCCQKYLRKAKGCKRCPLLAPLGKKERKLKVAELVAEAEAAELEKKRRKKLKSHLDSLPPAD
jgi:hypothetical protein